MRVWQPRRRTEQWTNKKKERHTHTRNKKWMNTVYRRVLFGGVNRYIYRLCPSVCTKKSAPIFMHSIVFCESVCCVLLFLLQLNLTHNLQKLKSKSTTTRLPATICYQRVHTDFWLSQVLSFLFLAFRKSVDTNFFCGLVCAFFYSSSFSHSTHKRNMRAYYEWTLSALNCAYMENVARQKFAMNSKLTIVQLTEWETKAAACVFGSWRLLLLFFFVLLFAKANIDLKKKTILAHIDDNHGRRWKTRWSRLES